MLRLNELAKLHAQSAEIEKLERLKLDLGPRHTDFLDESSKLHAESVETIAAISGRIPQETIDAISGCIPQKTIDAISGRISQETIDSISGNSLIKTLAASQVGVMQQIQASSMRQIFEQEEQAKKRAIDAIFQPYDHQKMLDKSSPYTAQVRALGKSIGGALTISDYAQAFPDQIDKLMGRVDYRSILDEASVRAAESLKLNARIDDLAKFYAGQSAAKALAEHSYLGGQTIADLMPSFDIDSISWLAKFKAERDRVERTRMDEYVRPISLAMDLIEALDGDDDAEAESIASSPEFGLPVLRAMLNLARQSDEERQEIRAGMEAAAEQGEQLELANGKMLEKINNGYQQRGDAKDKVLFVAWAQAGKIVVRNVNELLEKLKADNPLTGNYQPATLKSWYLEACPDVKLSGGRPRKQKT